MAFGAPPVVFAVSKLLIRLDYRVALNDVITLTTVSGAVCQAHKLLVQCHCQRCARTPGRIYARDSATRPAGPGYDSQG